MRVFTVPATTVTTVAVTTLAVAASLGLGASPGLSAPPVGGNTSPPGEARAPAPKVVAVGLANPRHLSFDGNRLVVAESGRGGAGPCVDGAEGRMCLGTTGALTQVQFTSVVVRKATKKRKAIRRTVVTQRRVVTGLPSAAAPDGSQATGVTGVLAQGANYTVTFGLGGRPAMRAELGRGADRLGTLTRLSRRAKTKGTRLGSAYHARKVADLAWWEKLNDPDRLGVDSNPTGLEKAPSGVVVVDSGGNSLVRVPKAGSKAKTRAVATFGKRMVTTPPFMPPGQIPMDSVPTAATRGADGAWYVAELTGFPFPVGGARVLRVVPGKAPSVWATGLTTVTDLEWHRGKLYAVQLADKGLLGTPQGQLHQGSLVQVRKGNVHRTVVSRLPAPYGVALRQGTAYVTTCSTCASSGEVVSVSVR